MAKKTKPAMGRPPYAEQREHASFYLPASMRVRLARYIAEQHGGKMNVRNQIILDALEALLQKEGY